MKYIIKNCPATYQNFEDKFVCTSQIKRKGFPFYCQDCTDCVIKQILEMCKSEKQKEETQRYKTNGYVLARNILNLLEIEEFDEE